MLVAQRKAQLRRTERERWSVGANREAFAEKSVAAQKRFLAAFPPGRGSLVGLYMPVAGEVGTERIRARYLEAGVRLFYPKVMEDGNLSFYPDGGDKGWVRGKYGLLEPRIHPGTDGLRGGFDLVVVPGMAFDAKGRRLGRGCGYYDRFLFGIAGGAMTVGLAFSLQLLPEVPVDAWDVPVDVVVTEEGVIRAVRERPNGQFK